MNPTQKVLEERIEEIRKRIKSGDISNNEKKELGMRIRELVGKVRSIKQKNKPIKPKKEPKFSECPEFRFIPYSHYTGESTLSSKHMEKSLQKFVKRKGLVQCFDLAREASRQLNEKEIVEMKKQVSEVTGTIIYDFHNVFEVTKIADQDQKDQWIPYDCNKPDAVEGLKFSWKSRINTMLKHKKAGRRIVILSYVPYRSPLSANVYKIICLTKFSLLVDELILCHCEEDKSGEKGEKTHTKGFLVHEEYKTHPNTKVVFADDKVINVQSAVSWMDKTNSIIIYYTEAVSTPEKCPEGAITFQSWEKMNDEFSKFFLKN